MYYTWRYTLNIDHTESYMLPIAYSWLHIIAVTTALNCNLTIKEYNGPVLIATDNIFVDITGIAIYDRMPKGTHLIIESDKDRDILFDLRARI